MTDAIRRRKRIDYREGKEAEYFFRKWTGADNAPKQMERDHIDCIWNGATIDVKGLKKSHLEGYVLVEFVTVDGRPGWGSSKSKADKIAFQFPEGFYVVDRIELSRLSQELALRHCKDGVAKRGDVSPSSNVYNLVGRPSRKDVFTYITKEDLLSLKPLLINEHYELG